MSGPPPVLRLAAVRVPGSTSNLGAGFDCVGLAIDRFLDAAFEPGEGPLAVLRPGGVEVPAGEDLVAVSFRRGLEAHGLEAKGVLRVRSGIPVACGLGSSAAALVAGSALAQIVVGGTLDPKAAFASAAEEEGHGDNAGASAMGGLVAALGGVGGGDGGAARLISLELSPSVGFAFAAPPSRVPTRAARAALPATVPHKVATGAVSAMAALLRGLATGDPDLLSRGFQDSLHVPYRLPLIAGAEDALEAALAAGGWAGTVSGAGSGLLAACPPAEADRVAAAMADAFARHHGEEGVAAFPLRPVPLGVRERRWGDDDGAGPGADRSSTPAVAE